jgi:hypothetical protein
LGVSLAVMATVKTSRARKLSTVAGKQPVVGTVVVCTPDCRAVEHGGGRAKGLTPAETVTGGWRIETGPKGSCKMLLHGGCVLRVGTDSAVQLGRRHKSGCPQVLVLRGRVALSAPQKMRGYVATVHEKARVQGGLLRLVKRPAGRVRICSVTGKVARWGYPPKKPVSSPTTGAATANTASGSPVKAKPLPAEEGSSGSATETPNSDTPAAKATSAPKKTPAPKKTTPVWLELKPATCHQGDTVQPAQPTDGDKLVAEQPPLAVPRVTLDLQPVLPKKRKSETGGGSGAGSDSVSAGGGGSMCLDSAGSGPGASNVQQGPSGIQKPPPTTRLKVKVRLDLN